MPQCKLQYAREHGHNNIRATPNATGCSVCAHVFVAMREAHGSVPAHGDCAYSDVNCCGSRVSTAGLDSGTQLVGSPAAATDQLVRCHVLPPRPLQQCAEQNRTDKPRDTLTQTPEAELLESGDAMLQCSSCRLRCLGSPCQRPRWVVCRRDTVLNKLHPS